jgi:hypothetical protein
VNVLARTSRIAVVAALLLLAACSRAAAPGLPAVTMSFCGSDPQVMPSVVLVICNTDDITARNLSWAAWGKPTATATGTATVDLCAYEDCHTGGFGSVPIMMIASDIVHCAKNSRAYSTLRYVFTHGSPWPGVPAHMNTSGYIAAPGRPLPPANQKVSLTCD